MSTSKKSNVFLALGGALLLVIAVAYLKQAYRTEPVQIATEVIKTDTLTLTEIEPIPVFDTSTLADSIIQFGMQQLGTPYVEAGNGEVGFDCSGFVYHVFKHFGIEVPRSSIAFDEFGTEVAIDQVKKGDVLLFLSPTRDEVGHVGIVSEPDGLKSHFIHSSSGEAMGVTVSSLTTKGYADRFVKAIRVL